MLDSRVPSQPASSRSVCLILFAHQVHPEFPLIVAANRDEFHGRPAAAAAFWSDEPGMLAGRDLEAGGTWLGVSRRGRFAAVTNFAEEPPDPLPPRSRGALVSDFLTGGRAAEAYLREVARHASEYRGFNLLVGDAQTLWYFSNRIPEPRQLAPGTYGLSNHLLDTNWPKVRQGKSALAVFEESEADPAVDPLLDLLADETSPTDAELRAAGLDPERMRRAAPCFIRGEAYGTRASTVVMMRRDGLIDFTEVAFGSNGRRSGRRDFSFETASSAEPKLDLSAVRSS